MEGADQPVLMWSSSAVLCFCIYEKKRFSRDITHLSFLFIT